MKAITEKQIAATMRALGATDGQDGKEWDPEVLRAAAESCLRGESAWAFKAGPDDDAEMERFAAAWNECQAED